MKSLRKHFKTIDSTNNWAKLYATELDPLAITLVTAEEQTGGRGRFNRRWESPPYQNVYASFCFFVEKDRRDIGNIPQILALSTVEVLQELSFKTELKWPNDILFNGKKLGGILCETLLLSENKCVVVGIGININMPLKELQKVDRPATSLYIETGQEFVVEEIIQKLQKCFVANLKLFLEKGFAIFFEKFISFFSHSQTCRLRFNDNQRIWEGFFHSINQDGTLNLLLDSGEIKAFVAGEILS